MDVKLLQRFIAVADQRSFVKAAEVLNASQPVLTRSIHMLEESLEVQLFERGPRGVVLTPFGEELLPRARALLNEFSRTNLAIKALRQKRHLHVAIGVSASFAEYIVPDAILQLVAQEPEIEIRVIAGGLPSVLNRLREAELDLVFGTRDANLDLTGLEFEPLVQEGLFVVARPSHPVFVIETLSNADLTGCKWVLPDDPDVIRSWQAVFERQGLTPPRLTLRTSSRSLTRRCLLMDDFLSITGHLSFYDEISNGALRIVPIGGGSTPSPSGLFLRSSNQLTPIGAALAVSLRRISASFNEKLPPVAAG